MVPRCGSHPDGCPCVARVVDGLYCGTTGVLIAEPDLVITDWTPFTNIISGKLRPGGVAARRQSSLQKRRVAARGVPAIESQLWRLFGAQSGTRQAAVKRTRAKISKRAAGVPCNTSLVDIMRCVRVRTGGMTQGVKCKATITTLARSISKLAHTRVNLPKLTYASLTAFPTVFAAAVMDKLAEGMIVNGKVIVPKLQVAAEHRIKNDQYKAMGVSCRQMSAVARELKANPPPATWAAELMAAEAAGWPTKL